MFADVVVHVVVVDASVDGVGVDFGVVVVLNVLLDVFIILVLLLGSF